MNAHSRRVNRRIRAAAFSVVETLESRAYLSGGVVLGTPVNTPTAANNMSPVQVNCADFTGSGKFDVYVANKNDTISVLLSKGDGSFQTPIKSYKVSGAPVSLATGQFTNSGHLDIVTGTTGAGSAMGDVSILLGNGNGTFQSAINIPALQSNYALAVGNFVTGGPLDILSVSNSASGVNNVCLTITDGTGHLASQTFFSTHYGDISSIAVGDFGNGHEDFAVTGPSIGSVLVYLGNGNGTFQTPTAYSTGTGTTPTSIVAGKFDASGNIDLVTADSTSGEISFLANQGDGIFGTAVPSPVAGSAKGGGPLSVGLGHFVSGSEQDLVCLLSPGSSGDATILLGNGDGTFRTGTTVTASGANAVAAGDLAGNGLSDLVVSSSSEISVLLNAPAASQLAFVQQPTNTTAGGTITPAITVRAETADGSLASSYNSNVTIAIASGPAGAVLGGVLTVKAVNGVATFSNLALKEAGLYTLKAIGGALSSVTSGSFTVSPASASKLVITKQPGTTVAGQAISPAMAVAVEDAYGNIVTGNSSTVTIAKYTGPAGSTITGTLTAAAVKGIATFGNLILTKAGAYTLKATDGILTFATSVSFTITPATASKLVITQEPVGTTAGSTLSAVKVSVEDKYGNVVTTNVSSVTLAIASGPVGATLGGTLTLAASAGVAAFSDLSLTKAGAYTLKATDGILTLAISNSFTITPATASKLVITQESVGTTAGSTLSTVKVSVEDKYGNLVTTNVSSVTLAIASGPAGAALGGTLTLAASSGVATFSNLSLTKAGAYKLKATDGVLVFATSTSFTITPAAASKLVINQEPVGTTAGSILSAVKVSVEDKYGNVVTTNVSSVTLAIASGPAGATLGGTLTLAAVTGVATFSNLSLTKAGAYTLKATDGVLALATSTSFTITPAAASKLVLSTIPETETAGTTLPSFTVSVEDKFGNLVTTNSTAVTFAIASGPAGAKINGKLTENAVKGIATFSGLSLDTAGTYTLKATDGSLTAAVSQSITINPAAASALAIASQPVKAAVDGTLSPLFVIDVIDAYGNIVTGDTSTVTLAIVSEPTGGAISGAPTATAVKGVATFSSFLEFKTVGTYIVKFTDGPLTQKTSLPIVVAPAFVDLANISVTVPATTVTLGSTFDAYVKITNEGNESATGLLDVLFEFSSSKTGSNPFQVANITASINLNAGQSETLHLIVPTALGSPSGNFYVFAVVDPAQTISGESNSMNNTMGTLTAVDFT